MCDGREHRLDEENGVLTASEQPDPRRRNRILLGLGALAIVLWLLWQAGNALLPFIIALALVYLLAPLIDLLGRFLPRILAILLVYVVVLGALTALGWLLVPAAVNQVTELIDSWPRYSERLMDATHDLQQWYQALDLPAGTRESLENGVRQSLSGLGDGVQVILLGTLRVVTRTLSLVFGFVIVPFWMFYVLKDKEMLVAGLYRLAPSGGREDARQVVGIVKGVLDAYIRGQALLGLVVGTATTIGLWLVGAPYWLLLGVLYGFTEVVPVLGPIVGAIPGLLVAALTGDWGLLLKILLVYVVVQQLENNFLVPKIQGENLNLHPAVIILVLIVAGQVAGLWGVFVAVPLAAISRDVYRYLYRRLGEGRAPQAAIRDSATPAAEEE
jgi:predicted PurR-regulated permease PerM